MNAKKKKRRKCWLVHRVISNLQVKIMGSILVPMMKLIDKLGYTIGQASLLACLDHIIYKGFDTTIDTYHAKIGLKRNVHAALFCLL